MTRSRLIVLAVLYLAPFAVLVGLGSYHLWSAGYLWVWWPLLGLVALAYLLAWRWTRGPGPLPDTAGPPPDYWTDRDRTAWEKVEAHARAAETVSLEQIGTAEHYTALALTLASEVGRVYSPSPTDPYDHLTLPEVLACVELVAADLDSLVRQYVPGAHLIRLRDVKTARVAYEWYKTGQTAYWAGAAVLDPVSTGLRFLAARVGLGTLADRIRGNLLRWFHAVYVRQLGYYLIELNSGRLKVGVKKYRELVAARQEPPGGQAAAPVAARQEPPGGQAAADRRVVPDGDGPPSPPPVTFAVVGPVGSGKSSLVNALLGKDAAAADRRAVPGGTRFDLTLPGGQTVIVRDTSGYGQRVGDEDLAAVEACRLADLILLVTPATGPGRAADIDLLDRLAAWFAERPHLRRPPVVVVLTHVDLLSPAAEWAPPYDWRAGTRPKERAVRECVAVVREQFGSRVADVVPVCARGGETFGVAEGLVPVLVSHLGEARGAAVLKAFEAVANERPVGKVVEQVGNVVAAGLDALSGWLRKKPK